MTIFYRLGNKLYINITNQCPCNCVFCIRNYTNGVGDAPTLWLPHEPTIGEIKAAFDARQDLNQVNEIVFCGYGEPMTRAQDVIEIAKYIKTKTSLLVRLNTNGLVNFLSPGFDISSLAIMDTISVSLNADDAEAYYRIVQPVYGIDTYNGLMQFITEAARYTKVQLTIMETLAPERIENCQRIAATLGLPLIVRSMTG